MHAGSLPQGSRRHLPPNRRVFVAKSALERDHQVPAATDIFRQPSQDSVAGHIERRNENHFVVGKVCAFWKDKINADIRAVERAVHLALYRVIVHTVTELHELNPVVGVVAVQNRDLILPPKIHNLRSNPL